MRTFAEKSEKAMDFSTIQFHHDFTMQLRYTDCDMQGHINNTVYFQYYNTAYVDYLRTVCPPAPKGTGIVAAHVEADFLEQVHIGDNVKVQTAVTHIGHKSFTLSQQLVDSDTGHVKCTGQTVMVSFDLERQESIPVPEEWVEAIRRFEHPEDC